MVARGLGPRQQLRSIEKVDRWYRNNARSGSGARSTAENYLRLLGAFTDYTKHSPVAFAALPPTRQADLVEDYIDHLLGRKIAGSTAGCHLKAIVSWLDYNEKRLPRRIKVPGRHVRPTLAGKRVIEPDELARIMAAADVRTRAMIAMLAFGGQRLEVLGDHEGHDGLKVGDFVEMTVKEGSIAFDNPTTKVVVSRPTLVKLKNGSGHFFFLGPEGREALRAWLQARMTRRRVYGQWREAETLMPDSGLFPPTYALDNGAGTRKQHVRTNNISDMIRKAIRRAGFNFRPNDLRHYFATQSLHAARHGFTEELRQFVMGQGGGIQRQYTLGRGAVAPHIEEHVRGAYEAALEHLEPSRAHAKDEATKWRDFVETELRLCGYAPEEISALDLRAKSHADLMQLLRESRLSQAPEPATVGAQGAPRIQPVAGPTPGTLDRRNVPLHEAKQLALDGWHQVEAWRDGTYTMERPSTEGPVKVPVPLTNGASSRRQPF